MNDNLNENATPSMAMPITMEETAPTNEPEHHVPPSLINVFLSAFEKHIDMLVETKFHAMLQNRQGSHEFITERQLSEKVGDVLDEILDDRVSELLDNATVSINV